MKEACLRGQKMGRSSRKESQVGMEKKWGLGWVWLRLRLRLRLGLLE